MTSWKEKGIVPDSDDEDGESDENYSGVGSGSVAQQTELNKNEGQAWNTSHAHEFQSLPPHSTGLEQLCLREPEVSHLLDALPEQSTEESESIRKTSNPLPSTNTTLKDTTIPKAKNVEHDEDSTTGDGQDYTENNFSRNYTLFDSPLSSLGPSQTPSPSVEIFAGEIARANTARDEVETGGAEDGHLEDVGDSAIIQDMQGYYFNGIRSLRQRNPIQLRPYAIESEKYRQTLRARGVKPLVLAAPESSPQHLTSTASQDQEFGPGDDSQIENFWDGLPSSPPIAALQTEQPVSILPHVVSRDSQELKGSQEDEEEEFPDIDKIIVRSGPDFVASGNKRQKTRTYSHKNRLHISSVVARRADPSRLATSDDDVFNFPASPPRTSPSILSSSIAKSKRVTTALSAPNTFTIAHSTGNNPSEAGTPHGTLLTPDVSSIARQADIIASDSEGEVSSSVESSSEPEPSPIRPSQAVQLRRVGKKIRGVLPASWLRLDAQIHQDEDHRPERTEQNGSLSPVKNAPHPRKGVAIPRAMPSNGEQNRPQHLSFSDEESDEQPVLKSPSKHSRRAVGDLGAIEDDFSYFDTGDIPEDNRIDGMLPGFEKRNSHRNRTIGKKTKSKMMFDRLPSTSTMQPRITEHLSTGTATKKAAGHRSARARRKSRSAENGTIPDQRSRRQSESSAPKLSILDVTDSIENKKDLPLFMRIAARNARKTADKKETIDRHSPTRKYIRLSNEEDTEDAQRTLREWTAGSIPQQAHQVRSAIMPDGNRLPKRAFPISKPTQGRLRFSLKTQNQAADSRNEVQQHKAPVPTMARINRSSYQPFKQVNPLRNAQLEMGADEKTLHSTALALAPGKKALDAVYKKGLKDSTIRGKIQLRRFLVKDNKRESTAVSSPTFAQPSPKPQNTEQQPPRRRKTTPKRLEVRAARFRQPTAPTVLNFFSQPDDEHNHSEKSKLLGLGTYGSTYTSTFDVLPLPNGSFFHEDTLIGSGRLVRSFSMSAIPVGSYERDTMSFQFGERVLHWSRWNETVASELGLYLDWVIGAATGSSIQAVESCSDKDPTSLIHLIDYFSSHATFANNAERLMAASKLATLMQGAIEQLQIFSTKEVAGTERELAAKTATQIMLLIFELQLGLSGLADNSIEFQLSNGLRESASVAIKLLICIGFEGVRRSCDDLQYFDIRENGIKDDQIAIQAWVIIITVLGSVNAPDISFWDLVNQHLKLDVVVQANDARMLEKLWYCIFSLLPLKEFDARGIVISGSRNRKSFENWTAIQKLSKRVFSLYLADSRQAPSFNDYCRSLLSRCYHLIQDWGWRRHGFVIGTFFDFFSALKLDHLRNEEVYKSPRFLEQLPDTPILSIDQEDRCFHIFLKIIAVSIKQLRAEDNIKAIRNLVARLLPNHDRQYPREEDIHESELSSLRNHHDLLSTLYFSAPPTLRPSLQTLRHLIDPGNCHIEAYLIQLRTWGQLARFVLKSTLPEDSYEPLGLWEQNCFNKLTIQYESVETQVSDSLQSFSSAARRTISQTYIDQVTQRNKEKITMAQIGHLRELANAIRVSNSASDANKIFGGQTGSSILRALQPEGDDTHAERLLAVLSVVKTYVTRIDDLIPIDWLPLDDDSQDFGEAGVFSGYERNSFFEILHNGILASCKKVIQQCLNSKSVFELSSQDTILFTSILQHWAGIVATICCGPDANFEVDFFLSQGKYGVFVTQDSNCIMREWALLLQAVLLQWNTKTLELVQKKVGFTHEMPSPGLDKQTEHLLKFELAVIDYGDATFMPVLYALIVPKEIFNRCRCYDILYGIGNHESSRSDLLSQLFSKKLLGNRDVSFFRRLGDDFDARMDLLSCITEELSAAKFLKSPSHVSSYEVVIHTLDSVTRYYDQECNDEAYSDFRSRVKRVTGILDGALQYGYSEYSQSVQFQQQLYEYGTQLDTTQGRSKFNYFVLNTVKACAVIFPQSNALANKLMEAMELVIRNQHDIAKYFSTEQLHRSIDGLLLPTAKYILKEIAPAFIKVAFEDSKGFYPATQFLIYADGYVNSRLAYNQTEEVLVDILPMLRSIVTGLRQTAWKHDFPLATSTVHLVYEIIRWIQTMFVALGLLAQKDKTNAGAETAILLELFFKFVTGVIAYPQEGVGETAYVPFLFSTSEHDRFYPLEKPAHWSLFSNASNLRVFNAANLEDDSEEEDDDGDGNAQVQSIAALFPPGPGSQNAVPRISAADIYEVSGFNLCHTHQSYTECLFHRFHAHINCQDGAEPYLGPSAASKAMAGIIEDDYNKLWRIDPVTSRVMIKHGIKYSPVASPKLRPEKGDFKILLKSIDDIVRHKVALSKLNYEGLGVLRLSFLRNTNPLGLIHVKGPEPIRNHSIIPNGGGDTFKRTGAPEQYRIGSFLSKTEFVKDYSEGLCDGCEEIMAECTCPHGSAQDEFEMLDLAQRKFDKFEPEHAKRKWRIKNGEPDLEKLWFGGRSAWHVGHHYHHQTAGLGGGSNLRKRKMDDEDETDEVESLRGHSKRRHRTADNGAEQMEVDSSDDDDLPSPGDSKWCVRESDFDRNKFRRMRGLVEGWSANYQPRDKESEGSDDEEEEEEEL